MKFSITILLIFYWNISFSQPGCTDIQATNYYSGAAVNDGSCLYPPTNLSLNTLTTLAVPLLNESSGVVVMDGAIWTQIDNTDYSIYRIDTLSASIFQQVTVNSTINTDWEDLAASDDHLYIGDFGNNYGNRINLHILKIAKTDLTSSAVTANAEVINFSYADQVDFTPYLNNNSFDCEAFFFYNDSLHLFTKDWVNKITKHYVLPADSGTHIATLVDSFDVNGLITSAAIQNNGVIVLLGYDNTGFAPCFTWMLYDYQGDQFFSGNKRMFSLGSAISIGQVEGIDFAGNNSGYITNERFQQLTFNVPPQLKSFDLSSYLPPMTTSELLLEEPHTTIKVFPVPTQDEINVLIIPFRENNIYDLLINDLNGKTVLKEKNIQNNTRLNIAKLMTGIYKGEIYMNNKLVTVLHVVKY